MSGWTDSFFYVTNLVPKGNLLKIWAQIDGSLVKAVNNYLLPLQPKFENFYGRSMSIPDYTIRTDMFCCARLNDSFQRAKILLLQHDGTVYVHFIDYGVEKTVRFEDIRILEGLPEYSIFNLAPASNEYVLANIFIKSELWDDRLIGVISRNLINNTYKGTWFINYQDRFLRLLVENRDFAEILIGRNLASQATFDMILSELHRIPLQPRMTPMEYPLQTTIRTSLRPPQSHTMSMHTNQENWRVPSLQQQYVQTKPLPQLQQHRPPPEACVFKYRAATIGESMLVQVTHVEDGPQKFAVRPADCNEAFSTLMKQIQSYPVKPLSEPPVLGSVCLGRESITCVLCRAVVMAIMDTKCKVYYVDFGHNEILSYTNIFQLPPEYVSPKVFCIRFTLCGIKNWNVTKEMKDYFKKITQDRKLSMLVCPQEGPPLLDYGELFDEHNVNIKDLLLEKFPDAEGSAVYPESKRLHKNARELVTVAFVESCGKFFIQLESQYPALENIMSVISKYAQDGVMKKLIKTETGTPCIALYEVDKQWYRGEIIEVSNNKIKVLYVDYGNEEYVSLDDLRVIPPDLVTQLPKQAIRCALVGFGSEPVDDEITEKFEKLVLEKHLNMNVINALPQSLVVELFESSSPTAAPNTGIAEVLKNFRKERAAVKENQLPPARSADRNESESWRNKEPQKFEKRFNENDRPVNQYDDRYKQSQNNQRNDRVSQDLGPNDRVNTFRSDNYPTYDSIDKFGRDGQRNDRFSRDKPRNDFRTDRRYDRSSDRKFDQGSRNTGSRRDSGTFNGNNRNNSWEEENSSESFSPKKFNGTSKSHTPRIESGSFDKPYSNDADFKSKHSTAPQPAVQKIASLSITLGEKREGELVFHNDPSDFYIHLLPDNSGLVKLMDKIAHIYKRGGKVLQSFEIKPGMYCIAQYSDDNEWYRAEIQSSQGSKVSVLFIDYGNVEQVPSAKIKEIEPEFLKLPKQAIRCNLLCARKTKFTPAEGKIFRNKIDGTPLQLEFINEVNGKYDVLVKVLHDVTKSYVNKLFEDAPTIKEKLPQQIKITSVSKVPEKIPVIVQPKLEWKPLSIAADSEHAVKICWFVTPNNFFVHLEINENEFNLLGEQIQKEYCKRSPMQDAVKVGSIVIAVFEEDGAFYRAEVIQIKNNQEYVVNYIDFGNQATVKQNMLFPVEERYTTMPKQAIPCSLKDVLAPGNKEWDKDNCQKIDGKLCDQPLKCNFKNKEDNKWMVYLLANGVDVASMLFDEKLAELSVVTSTPIPEIVQAVEMETLEINIDLLDGQILNVKIASIESAAEFYVQFPNVTICNKKVSAYMNEKDPKMIPLPGELSVMQNQAVQCSLNGISNMKEATEKLKKLVKVGMSVMIHVNEVDNNRLIVQLYNALGTKIAVLDNDEEHKICPIIPMQILRRTEKVSVSYLLNSEFIYVQKMSTMIAEKDLQAAMSEYYSSKRETMKPEVGELCAALSPTDDAWYRAKISQLTDKGAKVYYIDYGNHEDVAAESIKVLDPEFHRPEQLAVEVSLNVTLGGSMAKQLEILKPLLEYKEFEAIFYNVNKKWIVDFVEANGEKISQKLAAMNMVVDKAYPEAQVSPIADGQKYTVIVTHVDNPNQFWIQRKDEVAAIDAMQDELQNNAANYPNAENVVCKQLVAVPFSADEMWYRAQILDVFDGCITVRFVDYGNTDIIDCHKMKQLPEKWVSTKHYGIQCSLDVIPRDIEWSTTVNERLEKLVPSSHYVDMLVISNEKIARVDLLANGKSVSEILVAESLAMKGREIEDLNGEIEEELEMDPRSAFVSTMLSVNDFFLQEDKSIVQLEMMSHRLTMAEYFPVVEKVTDGMLCVAKFPDDDLWYRAVVLSHDDDGVMVRYIDYGNSAKVKSIRLIPEDLDKEKPLSIRCCLAKPDGVEHWPENITEKFKIMSADGLTIFLLDILEEGEISKVKLTLNSKDVAQELIEQCRMDTPVQHDANVEIRPVPIGEETSEIVTVGHAESPSEFWTHTESILDQLHDMIDHLRESDCFPPLTNFEVGSYCSARFPEDGAWYRAKILSHCEDAGTKVLFVDYGNTALTKEVRVLPEKLAKVPIMSTCNSLVLPQDLQTWPREACERFFDLAFDSNNKFECKVLDRSVEPLKVSLLFKGENVVDVILKEVREFKKGEEEKLCNQITEVVIQEISIEDDSAFQSEQTHSPLDNDSAATDDDLCVVYVEDSINSSASVDDKLTVVKTYIPNIETLREESVLEEHKLEKLADVTKSDEKRPSVSDEVGEPITDLPTDSESGLKINDVNSAPVEETIKTPEAESNLRSDLDEFLNTIRDEGEITSATEVIGSTNKLVEELDAISVEKTVEIVASEEITSATDVIESKNKLVEELDAITVENVPSKEITSASDVIETKNTLEEELDAITVENVASKEITSATDVIETKNKLEEELDAISVENVPSKEITSATDVIETKNKLEEELDAITVENVASKEITSATDVIESINKLEEELDAISIEKTVENVPSKDITSATDVIETKNKLEEELDAITVENVASKEITSGSGVIESINKLVEELDAFSVKNVPSQEITSSSEVTECRNKLVEELDAISVEKALENVPLHESNSEGEVKSVNKLIEELDKVSNEGTIEEIDVESQHSEHTDTSEVSNQHELSVDQIVMNIKINSIETKETDEKCTKQSEEILDSPMLQKKLDSVKCEIEKLVSDEESTECLEVDAVVIKSEDNSVDQKTNQD